MERTSIESCLVRKDLYEPSSGTVSFRPWQCFSDQQSEKQNQCLGEATANLLAEDIQHNEKGVKQQWNKRSFIKNTKDSDFLGWSTGTDQGSKVCTDLGSYTYPENRLVAAENLKMFLASSRRSSKSRALFHTRLCFGMIKQGQR